ncbi:transcription elongation factor GreA [Pajaroellobacter abortibovis]|uniref:Transcription elongation factor GreA n=1 Tax=Pajaroellobacter abortibovis TaxID=1882918 RepID=A0A1L6MX87_9BACT|nr:transcription elongation factor GreA [Pajaroellobacter abortibovis]APS00164.1 transcription elongation factor GreA [Pajaroellobacter abortibovis]
MEKNPISPTGFARLREELQHLRSVERPSIITAIAAAREHGDLSENAEYHAAREKQSFIEGRIKELEEKLSRSEVIDPAQVKGSRVAFGATVKLYNTDTEEITVYKILGADESDVNQGILSISSPLARALVGKEVGDKVTIRTPGGARAYEILELLYL